MLFRKKMDRSCTYCAHSTGLGDDRMLCTKCGLVNVDHSCRKFTYDPMKRVPAKPKAPDFDKFEADDFSL